MTLSVTEVLDGLLGKFLRPLRTWIEREVVAPLRAAYDAAMQTKEQYRDGVYLHLRERLEGTDEKPLAEGVPVRPLPEVQDLAHLQAAVELLDTRKVDVGNAIIPDGCSIPQLLLSSAREQVTEIYDDNTWTAQSARRFDYWKTLFPNLQKLTIGMRGRLNNPLFGNCNIEEIVVMIEENNSVVCASTDKSTTGLKHLALPILKKTMGSGTIVSEYNGNRFAELKRIDMPVMERMEGTSSICSTCNDSHEGVQVLYMPTLTYMASGAAFLYITNSGCRNLIDIEVGEMNTSFNFVKGNTTNWNPYNALATDSTSLVEEGEPFTSNREKFLYNFREHIAKKIADRTGQSTLTMTLSQVVRDALTSEIEDIIVSQKHWVISPAKSV